ncbi:hypothetical protein [uncultured Clostridium sp.]|uniref:hypothetical protein n=1 Tax=uncultured Clostridium sp. TaxID=59620 RepID=UPI0025CF0C71|nr:hypothetical protein [uncultured Clostridium sp.]
MKFVEFFLPQIGLYIKQLTGEIFFISKDSINKLMYCNKNIEDYIIFETIRFKLLLKYPGVEDNDMEAYNYAREVLEYFLKIDCKSIYKNSYWFNKLGDYAEGYIADNYNKIKKVIKQNKYMTFDDIFYDIILKDFDLE